MLANSSSWQIAKVFISPTPTPPSNSEVISLLQRMHVSNMKRRNCQRRNIACRPQLPDRSQLLTGKSAAGCWSRGSFVALAGGGEQKRKRNNQQGRRVYSASLSFSHTLCLCINTPARRIKKVWIFWLSWPVADVFFIFWSAYQGNAA